MILKFCIFALLFFFSILQTVTSAGEVRIAVASNFTSALKEIATHFEKTTGHSALISSGSSGKFFAQIIHGAPFDVFFSADVTRPQLLEQKAKVVEKSRFTYAVGRLALWSTDPSLLKTDGPTVLAKGSFKHLAIANPKTAPYGTAAQQALIALGLWEYVKDRIVQGENIGQTFHFVYSNNAQLGFVAQSQVIDPKIHKTGSYWEVPQNFYSPLRQQAVLLKKGQYNEAAQAFLDFIKTQKARNIIKQFGYGVE